MIPATTERVVQNTSSRLNEAICEQMRENVARYASASPQMLDQRLRELDHEWDIERITGLAASLGLLVGMAFTATLGLPWLLLPFLIALSLLLHDLIGWSPALPALRQAGYRTQREIDHERYALKALRGDFQPLAHHDTPQDLEDHARFEGEGGPPAPEPAPQASDPEIIDEALRAAQR